MCGRYYIEIAEPELRAIVEEAQGLSGTPLNTGEIFPTNIVPVITADGKPLAMKWGFARFDGKGHIINARSETAAGKTMFRRLLHEGRCLIPASNYFEWETMPDGKKQKYAISTDKPLMYMAGLYHYEKGSKLPSFVVLTKEATEDLRHIHNRMPVIISAEEQINWLDGNSGLFIEQNAEMKHRKA